MNATRDELHRVATHVLARARFLATGKFGLRATPDGFGTPMFGDDLRVIRVAGTTLVHERGGDAASIALNGSTLAGLAAFVEVDLDATFAAGDDTPPLGDRDAPLRVDDGTARELADWWRIGWHAMDAAATHARDPKTIQLWPEHFDAGTSVAIGDGENDRCNLGASPGDTFSDEPYLYVGPWSDARPGDRDYWNAPFGAVLTRSALLREGDPIDVSARFLCRGVDLLRGASN